MACPNISSEAWKNLVGKIGFRAAYREFIANNEVIPDASLYNEQMKGTDAAMKVVGALLDPKASSLFKRFYSSNPNKFYTELLNLGATKQQIELLKGINEVRQPKEIEEMVGWILEDMSYSIQFETGIGTFHATDNWFPDENQYEPIETSYAGPSDYYGNLVVPGGTSYRENRIFVPGIKPAISGHAQFADPSDIGWFRSDDVMPPVRPYAELEEEFNRTGSVVLSEPDPKTRRILEVQSDLFQKGRGMTVLETTDKDEFRRIRDTESYDKAVAVIEGTNSNQFLQLLNKDNAWAGIFVQSIIQDSVRRGYEKVVFPTGSTASKIEGLEVLEDYVKFREDRIAALSNAKIPKRPYEVREYDPQLGWAKETGKIEDRYYFNGDYFKTEEEALAGVRREIRQFQVELDAARSGSFQFGAIHSFYQDTIQNILRKRGYNPNEVTDSYGNTWFEVELKPEHQGTIFYSLESDFDRAMAEEHSIPWLDSDLEKTLAELGFDVKYGNTVRDKDGNIVVGAQGSVDMIRKLVQLTYHSNGLLVPEETAHAIIELLPADHPLLADMLEHIVHTDTYQQIKNDSTYKAKYNNNDLMLKKEAIGKVVSEHIYNTYSKSLTDLYASWWTKLKDWFRNVVARIFGNKSSRSAFQALAEKILNNDLSDLTPLSEYTDTYNALMDFESVEDIVVVDTNHGQYDWYMEAELISAAQAGDAEAANALAEFSEPIDYDEIDEADEVTPPPNAIALGEVTPDDPFGGLREEAEMAGQGNALEHRLRLASGQLRELTSEDEEALLEYVKWKFKKRKGPSRSKLIPQKGTTVLQSRINYPHISEISPWRTPYKSFVDGKSFTPRLKAVEQLASKITARNKVVDITKPLNFGAGFEKFLLEEIRKAYLAKNPNVKSIDINKLIRIYTKITNKVFNFFSVESTQGGYGNYNSEGAYIPYGISRVIPSADTMKPGHTEEGRTLIYSRGAPSAGSHNFTVKTSEGKTQTHGLGWYVHFDYSNGSNWHRLYNEFQTDILDNLFEEIRRAEDPVKATKRSLTATMLQKQVGDIPGMTQLVNKYDYDFDKILRDMSASENGWKTIQALMLSELGIQDQYNADRYNDYRANTIKEIQTKFHIERALKYAQKLLQVEFNHANIKFEKKYFSTQDKVNNELIADADREDWGSTSNNDIPEIAFQESDRGYDEDAHATLISENELLSMHERESRAEDRRKDPFKGEIFFTGVQEYNEIVDKMAERWASSDPLSKTLVSEIKSTFKINNDDIYAKVSKNTTDADGVVTTTSSKKQMYFSAKHAIYRKPAKAMKQLMRDILTLKRASHQYRLKMEKQQFYREVFQSQKALTELISTLAHESSRIETALLKNITVEARTVAEKEAKVRAYYNTLYKGWFKMTITHALLKAKTDGMQNVWMPTAQVMAMIEGNSIAAGLYAATEEVGKHFGANKFKVEAVGPFHAELSKVKGITYTYEQLPGAQPGVMALKVDISNFNATTPEFFNFKVSQKDKAMGFLIEQGITSRKKEKIKGLEYHLVSEKDLDGNLSKIEKINKSYYNKHGYKPFKLSEITDGTWSIEVDIPVEDTRPISADAATATILKVANRLQEAFNVEYEIVTEQKAQTVLGDIAYQGEPAFLSNGKIYFVDGKLTMESVLHEFAHPLMIGLRTMNPTAYENMYKMLLNTLDPQVMEVFAAVRSKYAFDEDSVEFMDEVMVRVLASDARNKLDGNKFGLFFKRLWFRIKELLGIYGNNDLSKLSSNTTLSDLSDMLAFSKEEVATSTDSPYVLFNRELAGELKEVGNDAVLVHIDMFKNVLRDHLMYLRDHNYSKLREALKNEADGSIPQDINSILRKADKLSDSIEDNFKKLRTFGEAIIGASKIAKKMREHVEQIHGTVSEQELLRVLSYYSRIADDWKDVFRNLAQMNAHKDNALGKYISSATADYNAIEDITKQVYKAGVLDVLMDQLRPIYEEVQKDYAQRIEDLQAKIDAGETRAQGWLDTLRKEYERFNLDETTVNEYLLGRMGDTNPFSALLESYTSSPDPIVGGFALYLKKNYMKVEAAIHEHSTRLRFELSKSYDELNITRTNPEALGSRLVSTDKIPTKGEDGKLVAHEAYVFMNDFGNGWLFDYRSAEQKVELAVAKGDRDEIRVARKELETLQKNWFNREYTENVYKAWEFWDRDSITQAARDARQEIITKMNLLEAQSEISEEDAEEIEGFQKELRQLRSLKNEDGSDKDPNSEAYAIAKVLIEYSELTKGLYGEYEIKGLFDREFKTYKDDLIDKGLTENSPEYKKAVDKWVRANVRFKLNEAFYNDRKTIIDEIDSIISKLGQEEAKKLSISDKWKEILETIRGVRDEDGQPIGSDLSDDKVAKVMELQNEIDEIRAALTRRNGLTQEEEDFRSTYLTYMQYGQPTTPDMDQKYGFITGKMTEFGLSQADQARLSVLYQRLKDFQTKIPTEYYVDTFNNMAEKYNISERISVITAEDMLTTLTMDPILQANPEFAAWFNKNHRSKTVYDNDSKLYVDKYERLYIWNRIVPSDDRVIDALNRGSYSDLYEMQHPYFEIKKARKFYFYRIKNEHKNGYNPETGRVQLTVGVHKDNRGNWLPRLDLPDSPYLNQDYIKLKVSSDPKDKALLHILETYKKAHLKVQDKAHNYAKLWYEIPRARKHKVEVVNAAVRDPKEFFKNMYYNVKHSMFGAKDDYDRNFLKPSDVRKEAKLYVMTDLFGNELQSIPMKYMSKIDKEYVSLDIFRSTMLYAVAIENNKMLHDINPIARALEKTVEDHGIQDVNKVSLYNYIGKHFGTGTKGKDNTRLKTLQRMFERDIEGIQKKMELGVLGDKVASHIMGLAAFGSLAMNIPAGIKNVLTARIQNVLEAVNNKTFTGKDWGEASGRFFTDLAPALVKDYNEFGEKALITQQWEMFDPVEGKYIEGLGKEGTNSYIRDFVHLAFTTSPQKFGEMNAQGTAWLAMMRKQRVTQEVNGVQTDIRYIDAWEKVKGVVQLKSGIDPTWGRGGDEFLKFKSKMHKVNELLQGAYAPLNQPELARFTSGKLALFMRRYLAPGIINRFGKKRINAAIGGPREGYFRTMMRMLGDMRKNGIKNWDIYSDDEKRSFMRTLVEAGYSALFMLLLLALGFGGSDDDKIKKLKQYDWMHQMAIYETLMVKGEVETFIPFPGMGMNEILRMKDSPSIAFPIINKYYKVITHSWALVTGDEAAYYQRKQGIWDKGTLKLYADLLRIGGYTGNTIEPDVAIKNYTQAMNRYN